MICTHLNTEPTLSADTFIAPGAVVVGDVTLGEQASVWYQSVLRADIEKIIIGAGSNIQDGAVIHMASDLGVIVGSHVTVGHKALLHACSIGDECLVGMGSIVMDGAEIGDQCLIGAGALVTRGMRVPAGSLVMGTPAKVIRPLLRQERQDLINWAKKYVRVAAEHREFLQNRSNLGEISS